MIEHPDRSDIHLGDGGGRSPSASPHVLIVGAGIGGLCLAQGLKQAGISVAIYERDASAHSRHQGYRLSIKEYGSQALRDCLPRRLFDLCLATSIKTATRMVFMDHQLQQSFAKSLPHSPASDASGFGVNRLTLREILLAGLDDAVHFGRTFERFASAGNGQVRAYFADGSAAEGDLLVGADGTHSAVRACLLPDAQVDDLRTIIYGKTPIAAGTLDWLPDELVDSFNRVNGPGGLALSVATCRAWEPAPHAAARLAPTLALTNVRDYLAWTLSLAGEAENADGPTLHRRAADTVHDWHPAVRRLIAEADIPTIFPITITSAQPVEPWQTSNVTLLGDAVHTMSPGRGEGANTALRDAALLRRALLDVMAHGAPLIEANARYQAEMLRYGFEAVDASLHAPFLRGRES
jgi:2-polyprenyl-6-methoxyphenol hydroxylase-like FAD-dependent oxidoreductase